MNPVIVTRRLCLRPFTGQDTDAIFAIYSDEQTNRFLPWFPAKTRADAECIFEERYARAGDGDGYALAVCFEDKPIGYVHLDGKPPMISDTRFYLHGRGRDWLRRHAPLFCGTPAQRGSRTLSQHMT